jgi:hypothetical protein
VHNPAIHHEDTQLQNKQNKATIAPKQNKQQQPSKANNRQNME